MRTSFLFLIVCGQFFGLPKGAEIQEGLVDIDLSLKEICVNSKSKTALLHWDSFSIDLDESVEFRLPSESGLIVNKVLGSEISSIQGLMSSNGQVILINPVGIVFGKEARIDVGSLIASTLDLQSDFSHGESLAFSGKSPGKLIQAGEIRAKTGIVCIGGEIEHFGATLANQSVSICAVDIISFNPQGFEIETSSAANGCLASEISGNIEAPAIHLLGKHISIHDYSMINASTAMHGGSIWIGGGDHGRLKELANAQSVHVHPQAKILANGGTEGHGGRAVIWSEEKTIFSGRIEAHGGALFGDGGFAEVSSRNILSFLGTADLHSSSGRLGTLLLDPLNIIVATGGAATYPDVNMFAVNPGTTQTIDPLTLDAVAGSVVLQAENDITFTNDISLTTPNAALTAQAGNNIYIDANIFTTGGDITLNAGPFSGATAPVATGSVRPSGALGSVTGSLDTTLGGSTTGSILVQGYDLNMNTASGRLVTDTGNITITAVNDCTFVGSPTFSETNTGQISITARGDISLNGALFANGLFTGTQISVIADSDHDHIGDLVYFSVSGSSHIIGTIDGNIFLGAENIRIEGPNPGNALNGSAGISTSAGGSVLIQAFHDFSMIGHGGASNSISGISCSGNTIVQAGNNLNFIGGSSGFVSGPIVTCTGNVEFYAGSNILIQPGTFGLSPSPQFDAPTLSFFAGRDITILSGPTMSGSVLLEGYTLLKIYAARSIQMSNNVLAAPSINPSGGTIDIRAGEDVFLSSSLATVGVNSITVIADAAIPVLWSAQPGVFLVGTPLATATSVASDLSGGFGISTAPFTSGISFTSVDGPIHLSSSDQFFSSLVCSLTIGDVANANQLTITSTTGDITVDPFFNIFITNPVSTGGNVFMIAQNDISMNPTGQIIAGGNVELVTDNQAPVAPLIGPGAFLMDSNASITYGGLLKIFTAIRSQNSVLGTFNGANFTPGTLFIDSNIERWCTYYPFAGLGSPYTIFYKECLGILSQQAALVTTEMLFDFHPADEFGPSLFSQPALFQILYSRGIEGSTESYWLRRRKLHFLNYPLRQRVADSFVW